MRPVCICCADAERRASALEEQVAWFKSELGLLTDAVELYNFTRDMGWPRQGNKAKILFHLYKSRVRFATGFQLQDLIEGDHELGDKNVDQYICKLRKDLGAEAIETVRGVGFALTPAGVAVVEQRLAAAGRQTKAA